MTMNAPTLHTATEDRDLRWREDAGPYLNRALLWIQVVLLGNVQAADVLLATSVFNVMIRGAEWTSQLIAICVALAATILSFEVGREKRVHGKAMLVTVLWVLLGLSMAALRVLEPFLRNQAVSPAAWLIAGFIFVVYLVSGYSISRVAYRLSNPKHSQLQASMRQLRRVQPRLAVKDSDFTRVDRVLALAPTEKQAGEEELKQVIAEATAGSEIQMHRARLLVAELNPRVEAAGTYRQTLVTRRPEEPAGE